MALALMILALLKSFYTLSRKSFLVREILVPRVESLVDCAYGLYCCVNAIGAVNSIAIASIKPTNISLEPQIDSKGPSSRALLRLK